MGFTQGQLWLCGWEGGVPWGAEKRSGEQEERPRGREIPGGNEQPWVWALFVKEVGILGHVLPICVLINTEL